MAPELADEPEVYLALVTGLRDYVRKNGFRSIALGLRGYRFCAGRRDRRRRAGAGTGERGVDAEPIPSQHSRDDAADQADRNGYAFRTVPIAPMFDAYQHELRLTGLAEENLQARIRTLP